jgi:hypothetical protein
MRIRPCPTHLAAALVAVLAVALLAAAPRAEASETFMWSVMQDDNQLIYDDADNRDRALDYMKTLGVDAVRVTVLWEAIAPRRKPRRSPANISVYPRKNWDRYDELVKAAAARGLIVYFSVTGPGPSWAHARSPDRANRRTWKPNARHFGNFLRALGKRYSGEYKDENADRAVLPRVSWWGVFNEPNQGGWLTPQAQQIRGVRGWTPTSPALYRELLVEGVRGLIATRHENDVVFMGETAPLGVDPQGERRPLRPAEFLRELFCLDKRLRRYSGRRARARDCSRVRRLSILKRLPNLGYAHHPYTKEAAPTQAPRHADSVSIANVRTLPALLDKIADRTGLIAEGLPIYLTEFGYESNPPDIINGIPAELQAEYLNVGDYIAFRNPRVVANTQFQLFDVPPQTRYRVNSREYWFTYQSGIFTHNGQPKPAAGAYALPFEARVAGPGGYLFWGWVRLGANNVPQTVYLQRKDASGAFQTVGDPIPVANPGGFWNLTLPGFPGETWRYAWASADGTDIRVSREIVLR